MTFMDTNSILEKIRNRKIDKFSAINLLILIIQSNNDTEIRSESINLLENLNAFDENLYKLIENLIISDADSIIRLKAIDILKRYYLGMALKPIKWAINHEEDYHCLISLIKILIQINNETSKILLLSFLKEKLYLKQENLIPLALQKYRTLIKKLYNEKIIEKFTQKHIGEIIIGYLTIYELIKKFYAVHYELDHKSYLPVKLDLSDIEFEVRGWKAEFRNCIENLSEIIGLTNLHSIEHLDLSNNHIKDLKDLTYLKNLKSLFISNNKIAHEKNLEYLKKLNKLEYLDISGNKIVKEQKKFTLNKETEIKIHKLNYFR